MGWFGDLFGFGGDGGDSRPEGTITSTPKPVQLPDYPEATAARENWGSTLKEWQTQPGYGAIQPNWNDIWDNARQRVQRYFMGGPEGPGLNAQVKANSARRGVAENPAGDTMLQRSGFQQGNTLQDIAVKMAMQEADLGESGRKTWLGSLQQLAGLKPAFAMGNEAKSSTPIPSLMQGIGDTLSSIGGNVAGTGSTGFDWLDSILGSGGDMFGGMFGEGSSDANSPMGQQSGIGDLSSMFGGGGGGGSSQGGAFTEEDSWWGDLIKMAAQAVGTYYGGPAGGAAAGSGADALV
jgi:hypothetical protein